MIWRSETAIALGLDKYITEIVIHNEGKGQEVDLKVESVIDAVEALRSSGGKIINGPFDIEIGKCAVVEDPWLNQYILIDSTKGTFKTDDEGNIIKK